MKKIDKVNRYRLVSRLRGFETEAKSLRVQIKKAEDKDRPSIRLREAKNAIGTDARHHLLAYAFLRGIPYKTLEPKCRANNEPSPALIYDAVRDFCITSFTSDEIREWINGENKASIEVKEIEEKKKPPKQVSPSFWKKLKDLVLEGE